MKSLTEFLKEQAERQEPGASARRQDREDWVAAVSRKVGQIEEWLRKADQYGILEIERWPYEKREEGLGYYEVDGLRIRLGAREVDVVPVARYVVAASQLLPSKPSGRIDLTDGETRYRLYRLKDPTERWVMIREKGAPVSFDEETFGAAVQDLLQ